MTTNNRRRVSAHLARPTAILAGVLLALSIAGPAAAHADLVTSSPEDGAVLGTPPTTITLTFSEGLDAGKSSFKLLGAGIFAIGGTGKAAEDGADVMTLGALVQDGRPLGPGVYQVQWTSVAGDGDVLRGTITFTVAEPTPAPATPTLASTEPSAMAPSAVPTKLPSAVPTPAPSADPGPASADADDALLPIIATLAIVAGIGALVLRRGRRA